MATNLKKIAAQCKNLSQSEHPAKSELSTLCTKIGEAGNKRKVEIENCQRVLLPQCDLQLASYISHQHTLETAGKEC
ncbi:hypothetical protein B566_EDAN004125 [Ephemera danica]|nr:hypothetical protein B566_EDAN004125 [Ephemera danica]